jgi:hypothetical protein
VGRSGMAKNPSAALTVDLAVPLVSSMTHCINHTPGKPFHYFLSFAAGPGQYDLVAKGGFTQIDKQNQHAQSLKQFGLHEFGIQLVKPTANFASRKKRFEQPINEANIADAGPGVMTVQPGPGQYEIKQTWAKS